MEDIIEYKGVDVKAPRYRKKTFNLLEKSFYNRFRKKYPQFKDTEKYPNVLLYDIIAEFNSCIYKEAVNSREGAELPEHLGFLFIGSCDTPKTKNINYGLSNKINKKVGLHNLHTDGGLAKIFYSNYDNKYMFPTRELWSFKACTNFKQLVHKTYPDNWMNYIKVEKHMIINKQYKAHVKRDKIIESINQVPDNYNEFEI